MYSHRKRKNWSIAAEQGTSSREEELSLTLVNIKENHQKPNDKFPDSPQLERLLCRISTNSTHG